MSVGMGTHTTQRGEGGVGMGTHTTMCAQSSDYSRKKKGFLQAP